MPEFKFTDSQCGSLRRCGLSDIAIGEIELLVQTEMLFLKNLSKVNYRIKIGSVNPIRTCISKLHKLLSEFDKDDICLLSGKESFLKELEFLDEQLANIPEGRAGNKETPFTEELDALASKIARIMIASGLKIKKRDKTLEAVIDTVFKATKFKRAATTAIKNRWWRDIEDWVLLGLDNNPDEQFEE